MIDRGVFQALAAENAKAIQGLKPRLWYTGSANDANGSGAGAAIGNIMRSLPPLLTTLYEQTGIAPPKWAVDIEKAVERNTNDKDDDDVEDDPKALYKKISEFRGSCGLSTPPK